MFSTLWAKVLVALAAIGAILGAVLRVFSQGKKAGAADVTVKAQQKEIEDVKASQEVERKVDAGKPGAAADELRNKWSRD